MMTNEELAVFAGLAEELKGSRETVELLHSRIDKLDETFNETMKEYESVRNECNRLRESEANALNSASEYKADCENAVNAANEVKKERDEARRKLFEWAKFVNHTVYNELLEAVKKDDCRAVVENLLESMQKFSKEHTLTITTGGIAK